MKTLSYFLPLIFSLSTLNAQNKPNGLSFEVNDAKCFSPGSPVKENDQPINTLNEGGIEGKKEKINIQPIVDKWVRETRPKGQWPKDMSELINKYSDIEKEDEITCLKREIKELLSTRKNFLVTHGFKSGEGYVIELNTKINLLNENITQIEKDIDKEIDIY